MANMQRHKSGEGLKPVNKTKIAELSKSPRLSSRFSISMKAR